MTLMLVLERRIKRQVDSQENEDTDKS
jgi:hypothetical protein